MEKSEYEYHSQSPYTPGADKLVGKPSEFMRKQPAGKAVHWAVRSVKCCAGNSKER